MAFKVQKGPKTDIFFIDRKGLYIPMDVMLDELDKRRKLSQKKVDIIKERKAVLKKLIRNNRYNMIRTGLFALMMLASFGAIMSSSQQTRKIGCYTLWASVVSNAVAASFMDDREKKLKRQDVYWLKKERELERI